MSANTSTDLSKKLEQVKRSTAIVSYVVDQAQGDDEVLLSVWRQIGALLNQPYSQVAPASTRPTPRGGRGRKSRGGSKTPKKDGQSQSPPSTSRKATGDQNQNPPLPSASKSSKESAKAVPLVDQDGVSRSTWKTRMRNSRQKCLENLASFEVNPSPRTLAILVNAYRTLQEQYARYSQLGLNTSKEADPFRNLPAADTIQLFEKILMDQDWKKEANGHFSIQTAEGISLRGMKVLDAYIKDNKPK